MAASFNKLDKSAPEKPGVLLAIVSMSTSPSNLLFFACTFKISILPFKSGTSTETCLSKRPGRNNAGSRMSALFVAATTMTPVLPSKPSISVNNWFNVCSLSSLPPPTPVPLDRPTASISSTKTMHGAFSFAFLNRSLTLEAPTPTNISTNSEPLMEKNGTPVGSYAARPYGASAGGYDCYGTGVYGTSAGGYGAATRYGPNTTGGPRAGGYAPGADVYDRRRCRSVPPVGGPNRYY